MNMFPFPTRKLTLFALLSAADFLLTWHLLSGGGVYESNPVAQWWLARHGWTGLACFKGAAMLSAAGLGVLLFASCPRTGHRVLAFACTAVAAVVLYSASLAGAMHRRPAADAVPDLETMKQRSRRIEEELRRGSEYRTALMGIGADLAASRYGLTEAVARLEGTEKANDPEWQKMLCRLYPGLTPRACLVANIIHHTMGDRARMPETRRLGTRLGEEFRSLYGVEMPVPPPAQYAVTPLAASHSHARRSGQ